ncbi:Rft-1-domain-containing protein [Nadsonia fulvescens var. elongata DSM 6958]|uniref:Man(5)GlcNAc(2)-PP-dolichol translocation protein RFT1 n=1 Tax=Nadsonia fulvescens var. elongata DSM 6958 TaxID=857566 RepID=A0A1E3PQQ4_9ASCO|nr:Rft-1-domain-containing protein [Nadsonia fulvescens var. elongata DSM 6958]
MSNTSFFDPAPLQTRPMRAKSLSKGHNRRPSSQILIPPIKPVSRPSSDKTIKEGDEALKGVENPLLASSATGATFLIGAQFFAKIVTFTLNQFLVRITQPETFGEMAQLDFMISTVLSFSREAIRLALQRVSLSSKPRNKNYRVEDGVVEGTLSGSIQSFVNFGYVSFFLGLAILLFSVPLYMHFGDLKRYDNFTMAFNIYTISAIIELASEPFFVLTQAQLKFKTRAQIESLAILGRGISTILVSVFFRDAGIIAFGIGQLVYSTILASLYLKSVLKDNKIREFGLTPTSILRDDVTTKRFYLENELRGLAITIWLQTIFKHLLSEGDHLIVSYFLSIADQGVYAVVGNYGSLLARIVFFPIEEAIRTFFSKLLIEPVSKKNKELSLTVLSSIIRAYTYISLLAIITGPTLGPFILQLLAGSYWSSTSAPSVFGFYILYIPFLAFNGSLEAFVQSVASASHLRRQSQAMILFTALFAFSSYFFMHAPFNWGAQGLIIANMLNMSVRIIWCSLWIKSYYKLKIFKNLVSDALPSKVILLSFLVNCAGAYYIVGIVNTVSEAFKILGFVLVFMSTIVWQEKDLFTRAIEILKRKLKKD